MIYVESPRESTKSSSELTNKFSKIVEHKINTRKSFAFLHTSNEKNPKRKTILPTITFKKKNNVE